MDNKYVWGDIGPLRFELVAYKVRALAFGAGFYFGVRLFSLWLDLGPFRTNGSVRLTLGEHGGDF